MLFANIISDAIMGLGLITFMAMMVVTAIIFYAAKSKMIPGIVSNLANPSPSEPEAPKA